MPTPVKPCEGRIDDELQSVLTLNRNREQWAVHSCQLCGAAVGAVQVHGQWVLEQHWPSVTYLPHNSPAKSHVRPTMQEDALQDPSLQLP